MIEYRDSLDSITAENLKGFFVGWPNPPLPETHLKILENSTYIILAVDDKTGNVIGFVNAFSDKVLAAYIPLLEVLPDYQKQGIGSELMRRMMQKLGGLYMIDLVCNKELTGYYEKYGLTDVDKFGVTAMIKRDFDVQSGKKE